MYNRFIIKLLLNFGFLVSFKTLDRGFIELIGPYGISTLFLNVANQLKLLQTGQIIHYICFIILSFCFLSLLVTFKKYIFFYFILVFFI